MRLMETEPGRKIVSDGWFSPSTGHNDHQLVLSALITRRRRCVAT